MSESTQPVAANYSPTPVLEPASYARCVVLADGIETSYRRAGRGAAVLFLGPPRNVGAAILDTLPCGFRVFAPELPSFAPSFCDWLRGFLDGLGVGSACIIAEREMILPALGFGVLEPLRVERLVVLVEGEPDEAPPAGGTPDHFDSAGHPLLVVCSDISDTERIDNAVDQVTAFLNG
jgi:hypothetical protein